MSEPTLNYVTCPDAAGGHRMAWWQWGDPQAAHVVICVHGLSRQGRDFDVLAQALCERSGGRLRVVCPDVVGRGRSDWLKDPAGYQVASYAADMLALLGALKPTTLDWVGTSMGGLIGMVLAGQPQLPCPFRKLVLNDVGPALSWQAIQRIGTYLGVPVRFDSIEQAAEALRLISAGFGPHTREQWLALTAPMLKPAGDGKGLMLHYDPAIALPFRALTPESSAQGEAVLWQLYDAIQADTLLLRGAQSDLLTPQTALAMTQRGPRARLVEFPGVGHAPTLVAANQVQTVCDFLLGASS
ncbi:MAG: alpha/beta hydrolase [Hydrogenophaga sp.]|uniref:alpha/beta fold hydrolase n=1 Tax=Hydrogenophaga sp. TaxID=1904254 RepID=UPI002732B510|nr:alpha/beta hydrolase [Hydrogenophaga sp.]MDP3629205.1 alpha/beta hydrolase [Hydrogenophaga sp.]